MKRLISLCLFTILLLTGCGGESTGANVWIDVPINNLTLADPKPITIEGHAASPGGVTLVEVWVNGDLIESLSPTSTSGDLAVFETSFTPTGPGEYIIQVVATGKNESTSNPDSAVVLIGEAAAAIPVEELPTATPTLVPTSTPTPIPSEDDDSDEDSAVITPEPVINFWADPETIEAGDCTYLYWDIANVSRVEFGGRDQEFSGSYHDCMCESQTYPLRVTYLDGTQETFRVTINVTGSCATTPPPTDTPTPIPDTTAPNPPTLLKPIDGNTFSCIPDTILRWESANDPSGISEYQIQVERHPGDNNWQAVSGSPFTGIAGLERLLTVECGYEYRWRVRAVDGAGNIGNWSNWFTFNIPPA